MTEPTPVSESSDRDALSLRHMLTIVLVGAALGVGFNAMQLSANPTRALAWVKTERHVVTLDDVSATPAATDASTPVAASATAPPAASATPAPARADSAKRDTARAHGKTPPATAKASPVTAGKPAAAAPTAPVSAPAGAAAAAPAVDLPVIPDSREPIEVSVDVAKKFHAAGAAVFLDARSAEEYAEGHIAGATNLPFDDVFKNPALTKNVDPKARVLITYCGGGDCDLSRSLAFSLIDAGFRKVLVFTGGIPAWTQAGLAVHKGAQP